MKNRSILASIFVFSSLLFVNAQCIKDIQNLIETPSPCFFIGSIDYDNPDCFDPFSGQSWNYTWKIRSADDGKLVATYYGVAFQHTFKKFGGYEFCLEVDKDGNLHTAELIDCVTYTTCQVCSEDEIKIEYVSCPIGAGCKVNVSTKVQAVNAVGLKPTAKVVVTYLPTPQELLGGWSSYDIEFDDLDIEYHPQTGMITVSDEVNVIYRRGCFIPRIVFELEEGAGAHGSDGLPCTEVTLYGEEKFRCIACANEDGDCIASIVASDISNTTNTCNIFTGCAGLREGASQDEISPSELGTRLVVSPNPASDEMRIFFPISDAKTREIHLTNSVGQRVRRQTLESIQDNITVQVSNLPAGVYFLTAVEDGLRVYSEQVLIARH